MLFLEIEGRHTVMRIELVMFHDILIGISHFLANVLTVDGVLVNIVCYSYIGSSSLGSSLVHLTILVGVVCCEEKAN